jgi:myo-inositol-hexaphosphate 3-phosphohydrolase
MVSTTVRFSQFNASLNRNIEGQLVSDLTNFNNPNNDAATQLRVNQAKTVAEIIQRNNPDILLINEFDYAPAAVDLFKQNFLQISQNGATPVTYQYGYIAPSNTGIASGFDLNNNGATVTTPSTTGYGDDSFGFGNFPGQFGMLLLSKYPIDTANIRTFQNFLWKDMPGNLLTNDPTVDNSATIVNENLNGFYSPAEINVLRLSSKSHWDIPIIINGETVHALVSHPTPPTFDGTEDRNGKRNYDEIRFWSDYVSAGKGSYIYDDKGGQGNLAPGSSFVIMGDQNADPNDGDSYNKAILQFLQNPNINTNFTPSSLGAPQQATLQGQLNNSHKGNSSFDTADFNDAAPGNLRADYILPSTDIQVTNSGVFWPVNTDPTFPLVGTFTSGIPGGFSSSDHRLVFADVKVGETEAGKTVVSAGLQGQTTFASNFIPTGAAQSINGVNVPVGGLSGVTYDAAKNQYYAISDDRSSNARFYTFTLNPVTNVVTFTNVVQLKDANGTAFVTNSLDPEGIALTSNGTVFISSEGEVRPDLGASRVTNPFIKEFSLTTGQEIKSLPVPQKFRPVVEDTNNNGVVDTGDTQITGVRNNLAFESLTITPDQKTLYTATENALFQDGPRTTLTTGSRSRIIQYNLVSGQPEKEYLYIADPIAKAPIGGTAADSGLVDLLAIDNRGTILALERSFAVGQGNTIKIYEISLQGATDINTIDSLNSLSAAQLAAIQPAQKRLVLNLDTLGLPNSDGNHPTGTDNIEGLAFGPKLADGRQSIVLVSDDNFNAATQFTQILTLSADVIPTVTPIVETRPDLLDDPNVSFSQRADADDPAIYVNGTDSSKSLVVTSVKNGGLRIYDLAGNLLQTINPTNIRYNNVDLQYGFTLGGQKIDIAVASDRNNDKLAIFKIDPNGTSGNYLANITDSSAATIFQGSPFTGSYSASTRSAYGLAIYRSPVTNDYYVFTSRRQTGDVAQLKLVDKGNGTIGYELVRNFTIPSSTTVGATPQTEGMVVDQETGFLYIGQEDVGIWKFNAEPNSSSTGKLIEKVKAEGGKNLTADVEGLTIYYGKNGTGYLLASSQGDNSFAAYTREGNNDFLGRFGVGNNGTIDSVQESDGADVINLPLGPNFPFGVFITQDGSNDPATIVNNENISSNFKLVPWENIANVFPQALNIDTSSYDPRNPVPQARLTNYEFTNLPKLGTTSTGTDILLGGFSGLYFQGLAANGNLKFVTHTDRGPNGDPTGNNRPFYLPNFQPEIVSFELNKQTDALAITKRTGLFEKDGTTPLTGLPNLQAGANGTAYTDEVAVDLNGQVIPNKALGADLEGIVIAPNGNYWLVDEYRPAIYHFDINGKLIDRFIPQGTATAPAPDAAPGTFGTEVLPAVYGQRRNNRGFEAVALEGNKLYAFIQSAIDNPDNASDTTSRNSRNLRILEFDIVSKTVTGEYLYLLDNITGTGSARTDKIGDAVSLGNGKFAVVERDDRGDNTANKLIYQIDLTGATNINNPANFTLPAGKTIEQLTAAELATAQITLVSKSLIANAAQLGYTGVEKLEGLALVAPNTLALINDNDFNVSGNTSIQKLGILELPNSIASVDLELSQTVNVNNPVIGNEVTFTLTLANKGPLLANGIKVTDLLPQQFTFVSATPQQGTYNNQTGVWDVGEIAGNAARTLQITAKIAQSGALINRAEITAQNQVDFDSKPGNNNAQEDDQVSTTLNTSSPMTTLKGFASLPADTFAAGPAAGAAVTNPTNGKPTPFPGQPVQGFSGVQFAPNGSGSSFWFLADNGFGAKNNSADFLLRIYQVDPNFAGTENGDKSVAIQRFIQLSDPNKLIPFKIVNDTSVKRELTGADFDPESFVIDAKGDIWVGDEFGTYVLHFNSNGVLLDAPFATPNPVQLNTLNGQVPIVIGHRGASGERPEHTIESYRLAILRGADFIEPDLVSTKDGILIARHEPNLINTTDVASRSEFASRKKTVMVDGVAEEGFFASDFTLAEIKTLRAVMPQGFRTQIYNGLLDIPTLAEIIDLVKEVEAQTGKKIGIYPETKHPTYHDNLGLSLEEKLIDTLKTKNFTDPKRVFIQSFEVSNLKDLNNTIMPAAGVNLPLVQLLDAYDVADDGTLLYQDVNARPYDFTVLGDNRTYGDLLTPAGLKEIAAYADGIGPWKRQIVSVKIVDNNNDGQADDLNNDGVINDADKVTASPTSLVSDAHKEGLVVHPYTFRNESRSLASNYNNNPELEYRQFINLGVDGYFTDFPGTGDLVRDEITTNQVRSPQNPTVLSVPKFDTLTGLAPVVIGHRGASGERPEHTLASYKLAIAQGADFIEPDLVVTKDGFLIARHEPMLAVAVITNGIIQRDTNGKPVINTTDTGTDVYLRDKFADRLKIKNLDGRNVAGWFAEDFTLAEVKELNAIERIPALRGTAFDNDGLKVPTLKEVIDLVKQVELETGRKIGIYPETKHPTFFQQQGINTSQILATTLKTENFTNPTRVFIQSFEVANLKELKNTIMPTAGIDIPLVQLFGGSGQPYDFVVSGDTRTYTDISTIAGLAEIATYAKGIGPNKQRIIPQLTVDANNDGKADDLNGDGQISDGDRVLGTPTTLIQDAHQAGLIVHLYTLRNDSFFLPASYNGDPGAEFRKFIDLGVDGFFTDFPKTGRQVLVNNYLAGTGYANPNSNFNTPYFANSPVYFDPNQPYYGDLVKANLNRSQGFEGMAFSPDRQTLYPLLEGTVVGDAVGSLRIYKFDVATKAFTGIVGRYQLASTSHAIGDFTPINNNEFLIIERDNNQGSAAAFKKIFKVDFSKIDANGFVSKEEIANLLNIQDANDLNGDGNTTYKMPFQTIESVLILDSNTILVANDNNYPFSIGRPPAIDNNEMVVLELDKPLALDSRLGVSADVYNLINGTSGNNSLTATTNPDRIFGNAGNDTITSTIANAGQNDLFDGGIGTDTLVISGGTALTALTLNIANTSNQLSGISGLLVQNFESFNFANFLGNLNSTGSAGNDTITGGAGNDTLDGGAGINTLKGGSGDDTYIISTLTNTITEAANAGVDSVFSSITYTLATNVENLVLTGTTDLNGTGNTLNNTLTGNSGNNILNGGTGADTLVGGSGNDVYYVENTGDVVIENGGEGTDTVISSVSFTLVNSENLTLTGTENINGTGDDANNRITGNSGNNIITGGAGNDTLTGGTGADTLVGGLGNDVYYVDNTGDVVIENDGEGTDTVISSVSFTLVNSENLTLTGTENINGTGDDANNRITGNSGNNIITGGAGNDTLTGGTGADTLVGGLGNDVYYVDNTGDVVIENDGEGTDTVISSVSFTLVNSENLTLTGTDNINGTGDDANNRITGNSSNNIITGGAGNDTLTGGTGADTLVGGLGNDVYYVENTGDVVIENGGEGTDTVISSVSFTLVNSENLTLTGTDNINATGDDANNRITGNSGNNIITGGAGNDTLTGGTGADALVGGLGNDVYYVDNTNDSVFELFDEGIDTVNTNVTYTLSDSVENLTLTGSSSINGTGNSLNNMITGNTSINILSGGTGADIFYLGLNDAASDIVNYAAGDGADTIYQFERTTSGDKLQFSGITNIDVVRLGASTQLRVGDGITTNTGFGKGQLLVTLSGTSGFTGANVNDNLFGSNFSFS